MGSAVADTLAKRSEMCPACCLEVSLTRMDGVPRVSRASVAKVRARSGDAALAVMEELFEKKCSRARSASAFLLLAMILSGGAKFLDF